MNSDKWVAATIITVTLSILVSMSVDNASDNWAKVQVARITAACSK